MIRLSAMLVRFIVIALLAVSSVRPAAQSSATADFPGGRPASAPPDAQRAPASPRFKGGVDVVVVDVCVRGRNGQFLPGLSLDDFVIVQNNVAQNVAFFSAADPVPLAVALVVDRSQSMAGAKLERAKAAAGAFLERLKPDDQVEVLAFNEVASRLFPLGTNHVAARETLSGLVATGVTGLYETVLVALRDLQRAQRAWTAEYRKAIVVLSDGEDTSSRVPFDDLLEEVRRSGVLVYAISLRTDDHDRWLAPLRELAQLAYDSGGQAVAVRTLESLVITYEEISADLRHLYRLAYVPSPGVRDGRWHPITVRVRNPDARVRARSGYYAPRPLRPS